MIWVDKYNSEETPSSFPDWWPKTDVELYERLRDLEEKLKTLEKAIQNEKNSK